MTIELLACTRQVNQYASDSIGLNKLLSHTGILAFIISSLMVLIIMVFYPAKPGTGFYVLVKIFMYMFAGTLILVFLHDGIIKDQINNTAKDWELSDMVTNVTDKGSNSRMAFGGAPHKIQKSPTHNVTMHHDQSPQQSPKHSPTMHHTHTQSPETTTDLINGGGHKQLTNRKPPVVVRKPFL